MAFVMLVPIVPVLLLGDSWLWDPNAWGRTLASPVMLAVGASGLLALDIFLPVPSAPLIVLLASRLGALPAAFVGVVGLTLGGLLGYAFALYGGRTLASRYVDANELERWESVFKRQGWWLLLMTRPAPVVAECVVLAAGLGRMPWRSAAVALLMGNAIIVAFYVALGAIAARHEMTLAAVFAIALASILSIRFVRRYTKQR